MPAHGQLGQWFPRHGTTVKRFGQNPVIASGTVPEDVEPTGGLIHWPATAGTATVTSGSINDDVGGTGAEYLVLEGLDANYRKQTETVALNGTGNVTTTNTFIRIQRAYVTQAGSGLENDGAITCTLDGGTIFTIPAGANHTLHGAYTIPGDHVGFLMGGQVSLDRQTSASAVAEVRLRPGAVVGEDGHPWLMRNKFSFSQSDTANFDNLVEAPLAPRTDVRIQVVSTTATIDVYMVADFVLIPQPKRLVTAWDAYFAGTGAKPGLEF